MSERLTKDIGPAGGRIDAADGSLSVIVPPGAFDRVHTVGLQAISNEALGKQGRAWRITPHGLDTPVPMTIEWRYRPDESAGAATGSMGIAFQGADGVWRTIAQTEHDRASRTLRVQTNHFSDWSHVAGMRLLPGRATVRVGETLPLVISRCESRNDTSDPRVRPIVRCDAQLLNSFEGYAWELNGTAVTAGAITASGTLRPSEDPTVPATTLYTAPGSVPTANPVAISASYMDPAIGERITLVSQVEVVDAGAGCNWLQDVQAFSGELDLAYRLIGRAGSPFDLSLDHAAQASALLRRIPAQLPYVRWQGDLNGTVRVNDTRILATSAGTVVTTLTGTGTTYLGPTTPGSSFVTLQVNILDCTVSFGGALAVIALETNQGIAGNPGDRGVGAFAIDVRTIAGRREFLGEEPMPGQPDGFQGDAYLPSGLGQAMLSEPAGNANLRWAFKPVF